MASERDFILDLWREACRHIAIGEFADALLELLAPKLPVARVIICRINAELQRVDTVADSPGGVAPEHERHHARWDREMVERLLRWGRRGELAVRRSDVKPPSAPLAAIPDSLHGEAIVAPLARDRTIEGIIILEAAGSARFSAAHERIVRLLLEPLAVALENDRRLRELEALREAAESEKRTLLTRLGREDLSEAIIGVDGGLRAVMERVERVARSDVPVLLLGETGSGKEVVARAIHNRSLVREGPFIRVNCGAISPELIDSELFGHEKGSFTGAAAVRRGWFERADEGTLFLDEMGELPPAAQVRLLRVLQDGVFERVGGEESVKVDVRIVAATHRDLAAMVQAGEFREDLWYRLAVFPIVLPPLRERSEDIPALAEHFAARAAKRFGLKPHLPTAPEISLLTSYRWPGNVRELASVIDRAAILGDGERLDVAGALGTGGPARPAASAAPSPVAESSASLLPLDAAIRRHIEMALAATDGRVEGPRGAARLLRINPHTLRGRMRKLGIDWSSIRAEARRRNE